jgi:hypothetical protein
MARKNVIQISIELVDKASKELKEIGSKFRAFARTVTSVALRVGGAFAVATSAFLAFFNQITKTAASFNTFSEALGISVEELSQLAFHAQQTDVSMSTLKRGAESMTNAIDTASKGVGIAVESFKELDVNAKELNQLELIDQLLVLADRFDNVESETRKLIIANDIFGPSASNMVRLIKGGSDAIRANAKESNRLGNTLSTEAAEGATAFQEALTKLNSSIKTFNEEFILAFGPALTELITYFTDLTTAAGNALEKLKLFAGPNDLESAQLAQAKALHAQMLLLQEYGSIEAIGKIPKVWARFWGLEAEIIGHKALIKQFNEELQNTADIVNDLATRPTPIVGGVVPDPLMSELDNLFPEITRHRIPKGQEGDQRSEQHQEILAIDRELRQLERDWENYWTFMTNISESAAKSIQRSLADFFFDPFEDGMKGMLKSFIDVIRRMIAEWLAFTVLSKFGLGKLLSASLTGRASGGPVAAGQPYIVGERGPELFVPGSSGKIIPSGGSMGGGMNFVTNIDARGADPGLIARLPQIMDQRDRRLMLKVKDYVETGAISL